MFVFLLQILDIERPVEVPQEGIVCDILWSDPSKVHVLRSNVMSVNVLFLLKIRIISIFPFCQDTVGWEPSDRGVSYVFGRDIVDAFLNRNNLSLIVR